MPFEVVQNSTRFNDWNKKYTLLPSLVRVLVSFTVKWIFQMLWLLFLPFKHVVFTFKLFGFEIDDFSPFLFFFCFFFVLVFISTCESRLEKICIDIWSRSPLAQSEGVALVWKCLWPYVRCLPWSHYIAPNTYPNRTKESPHSPWPLITTHRLAVVLGCKLWTWLQRLG